MAKDNAQQKKARTTKAVADPRADEIAAKKERDKIVEGLARKLAGEFGMSEERWRSFEVEARKLLVAHEHLNADPVEEAEPEA